VGKATRFNILLSCPFVSQPFPQDEVDADALKFIEKLGFYTMIAGSPLVMLFAFGFGCMSPAAVSMGAQSMNSWLLFPYFLGVVAYAFGYLMGLVNKQNDSNNRKL